MMIVVGWDGSDIRSPLGLDGVAAELLAHGGQELVAERRRLARAEAAFQRHGDDRDRAAQVDGLSHDKFPLLARQTSRLELT